MKYYVTLTGLNYRFATAKVKYVLANAVVCKVKMPLGAEPAEDGEEDISF